MRNSEGSFFTGIGLSMLTIVVMFLFAIELGQTLVGGTLDAIALAAALIVLFMMPFVSENLTARESVAKFCRGILVCVIGVGIGILLRKASTPLFTENLRFVPMKLLIISALILCYTQFYSLLKVRITR
jgi:hypothetical protein